MKNQAANNKKSNLHYFTINEFENQTVIEVDISIKPIKQKEQKEQEKSVPF